jgi:hypothetical protein
MTKIYAPTTLSETYRQKLGMTEDEYVEFITECAETCLRLGLDLFYVVERFVDLATHTQELQQKSD